jgi:protein-L-isoaspartate(D-aspartate) O-methyltransferase
MMRTITMGADVPLVAETLGARLAKFASSLRQAGAIRSDTVENAFANVARHRCVPLFHYGAKIINVRQDEVPSGDVLDLIYSHQALLTSTGRDGDPPSSSSAPTLMARMLEALDLRPGMHVLEIGAGTGYNAALITTTTGAPVVTVDAGASTADGADDSIRRLGLDHRVTVVHGDGYLGEPNHGRYDRIIVTCGVAGLSPHWLDQLTPGGLILAPIAHGGVHPVLAASHDHGTVCATATLWADFMPAAGPLRPVELVGHDPAEHVPSAPVTRIPDASPARTTAAYNDLWFFLAARDPRITRAYMDDTIDPANGACALHTRRHGTAWVHADGTMTTTHQPTAADELRALIHEWTATGRPALTEFTAVLNPADTDLELWTPSRWLTANATRQA